jgi:hypothetical protein
VNIQQAFDDAVQGKLPRAQVFLISNRQGDGECTYAVGTVHYLQEEWVKWDRPGGAMFVHVPPRFASAAGEPLLRLFSDQTHGVANPNGPQPFDVDQADQISITISETSKGVFLIALRDAAGSSLRFHATELGGLLYGHADPSDPFQSIYALSLVNTDPAPL